MSYKEIYDKLKQHLTDEEIAEAYLIPEDLSEEERAKAEEEIRQYRFQLLAQQTEEDRIFSELMRLRILIREYLKQDDYSEKQSFGQYLAKYQRIFGKSQKELAEDLGIHPTRLNRLLHDREEPNIALTYRLEHHSGGLLPALLWWRLLVKKQEHLIRRDEEARTAEAAKVKNEFRGGVK